MKDTTGRPATPPASTVGASRKENGNNYNGLEGGANSGAYRLRWENHTHESDGLQAGQLDHGLAMTAASLLDDDHTQYVLKSLFDAQSILIAIADDTPVALVFPASRLFGRKASGDLGLLTGAETLVILSAQAAAAFDWNNQNLTNLASLITDTGTPRDLPVDCGANKTILLSQPVWEDINLGGAVLSVIDLATLRDEFVDENGDDTGIETWALGVNEGVQGSFEIAHDYKEGTDIYFHVHWQGIDAPSGTDNVRWQLTYTVARVDETLDAPTVIAVETAFDTQYEFKRSDFAAITGTNFKIGDQFLFSLTRIASVGDAYAGDALIATVGIHYQIDTIGSRSLETK